MGLLAVFIYAMFKKYQAKKETQFRPKMQPMGAGKLESLFRLSGKRHLFHITLVLLTGGLYLSIYLVIIGFNWATGRPLK